MAREAVAGVLLAAGAGRRMGMPKALVAYHGRLLVDAAVDVLRDGGCAPVVVVLGALAAEVRSGARLTDCVVVDNAAWRTGMGSSLRVGLAALGAENAAAAAILPVDVPGVTAAAVARVAALAGPDVLVRASYAGLPGHPVVIGRSHWAGVIDAAVGDIGARDYLRAHQVIDVPCADISSGADVDRPEDLDRLGLDRDDPLV